MMSKTFISLSQMMLGLVLMLAVQHSAWAQCDPNFSGFAYTGTSNPGNTATILVGETGTLTFNAGIGVQKTCNAAAGNVAGAFTINIQFPAEYAPAPGVVVGGVAASLYNWTYDAVTRVLSGTNNATIPFGGNGTFTVPVVGEVVTASNSISLTSGSLILNNGISNLSTLNDAATAGLNVDPANVGPTAIADMASTAFNTPVSIPVLTNDIPGSSAIDPTLVKLIDPVTGNPVTTVTVLGEGVYTVDPVTGAVVFAPEVGFGGPVTPINYTVTDVNGLTSPPAAITVTITINPPVTTPDVATTTPGNPVTITVLTNDTPGSLPIDPASVRLVDPTTGNPVTTVTIPGQGSYVVQPTGTVIFTPEPGFTGNPTPVNYTVSDVEGTVSNPSSITVTMAQGPTATNDTRTTPVNTPVDVAVLTNDTPGSAPIDPTTVKLIDPVSGLPVSTVTIAGEGTYVVNPTTGVVTFTPVPGFTGVATPVTYTVNDINGVTSNPATVTITITSTPPVATNDTGTSIAGAPVAVAVLINDTPGSAPIDPTLVKLIDPVSGLPVSTVTITGEGTYVVDPITGVVTFTPDPALTTPIISTVMYTVTDTNGQTSTPATITIDTTPLPVTLTVFNVNREGTVAQLSWSTTEESNSSHFEVERSGNGQAWTKIGQVVSNGESKVLRNYSFADAQPLRGGNLYRLKMVDLDETFAYSRIRSLTFEGNGNIDLSVYPNPVVERMYIRDFTTVSQVTITDMTGRTVHHSGTTTTGEVNVAQLGAGIYMVRINRSNGLSSTQKIVVGKK